MNVSGTFVSLPPPSAKCNCQRSSKPGDAITFFQPKGSPPLLGPLFMMATRGAMPQMALDDSPPWCVVRYRSTLPTLLSGQRSASSLFQVKSPKSANRNLPNVTTTPTDCEFS